MAGSDKPQDTAKTDLEDMELNGMVYVATVRSPIARGKILSIIPPVLPPGYRIILPQDIPGENHIVSFGTEVPILASGSVSYLGEPLALIAGPDSVRAASFAAAVQIDYEAEEPLLNWESFSSGQVLAKRVAVVGDPDLAFSIARQALESTFTTGSIEHYYSEPQGALACFDYDKFAIWCATQWPYHVRDSVALVLGCKASEVAVRPTRLGVHLDGKLWYPSLLACHAALAAYLCRRPAKILLQRREDFLYTPKRASSSISLRAAVDPNGRLSAIDARIAVNVGAYGPLAEETLSQICLAATGVYSCPNVRIEGYAVTTNTPPMGAFGGLGAGQAFFAIESEAARLAQFLGEDPLDWKSRNVLKKGSRLITGEVLKDDTKYDEIASKLALASDYRRKYACYELVRKRRTDRYDGPMRGIGFSFAYQSAGVFFSGGDSNVYTVEASLDKDLHLVIKTSAAASSESVRRIWCETASAAVDIPPESVSIAPPDTDRSPNSGPLTLSRGITVINRLVERVCTAIQKKRFRDPLPLTARAVYRLPKPVRWEEGHVSGQPLEGAAWGGAVVEVELDPWTLEIRPVGVWICADGGRIVAPARAEASLRVAAASAVSLCLRERLPAESEHISDESFFEYGILGANELPPIHVELLQGDKRDESKGIGELPFNTVPAAFLAALSQAAGMAFHTIPVQPADLAAPAAEAAGGDAK